MDWTTLVFGLPIALAILLGATALVGFGDVDLEVDVEAEAELESGSLLSLLGVGRAPLSILLSVGLLAFGASGLALTAMVGASVALAVAVVTAPLATALIGRLLGRFVPSAETYAARQEDLIGCSGVARLRVDPDFGVAQVRDAHGSLHEIRCRADEALLAGEAVVVVAYGADAGHFEVASLDTLALDAPRS